MRIIFYCLLLGFLLGRMPVSQADTDSGTSQNLLLRYSIHKDWYLASISNFATRTGIDEFAISYVDLTLGRKLGSGFAIDAGYRRAWINIGGTRNEHRPLINLSWRGVRDGWFILNRARLEHRIFEADFLDDRFRFRNQLLLVSPWQLPGTSARWFLEEEFFYEFDDNGFNLNWITTGFRIPVTKGVTFKVGYRWQAQKLGGEWGTRHVFVTGINWFF